MLTNIHISNFAIIDQLSVDVKPGFTVLTGETGAGKSIWIDALLLTLGARADNSVIGANKDSAEISASFAIHHNAAAKAWLIANEFTDDECILTRIIQRHSTSKALINGRPVPAQLLQQIGELLLTLHTQHQYQLLLKPDWQLSLLDDFAEHAELLKNVQTLYQQWKQLFAEREKLLTVHQQHNKIDWLRYQAAELAQLAISREELATLDAEQKRLSNAQQLIQHANAAWHCLSEADFAVRKQLQQALNALQQIHKKDSSIDSSIELLNNAMIQVNEAIDEIEAYLGHLQVDPAALQALDQRLGAIHDAARKHRVTPEELPQFAQQLADELNQLETAGQQIQQLNQAINAIEKKYTQASKQLSHSRQTSAKLFAAAIKDKLNQLGMPQAHFTLDFQTQNGLHPNGSDKIEFLFSANPGIKTAPLKKIASGGELSRISLAIHVISSEKSAIPTLIFDEIDAGVSGKTAVAIGELLRQLGRHTQVISITHLAQVAALGQQHLKVDKLIKQAHTHTTIQELNPEQRIEEIARMIGGSKITERTRQHAEEMLDLASMSP